MKKRGNPVKKLFVLSALLLITLVFSLILIVIIGKWHGLTSVGDKEQLRGYKSYVLRLDNPSIESASKLIKPAILKEARNCNCLTDGFPKVSVLAQEYSYNYTGSYIAINRIIFDNSRCGFVDFPAGPSSMAPMIDIYLLPKGIQGIFSKVQPGHTLHMYIITGVYGGPACSVFDPEFIKNEQIVLSALWTIGVRGFEKYD